jgi:aminopeptidase YwaD
MRSIAVCCLVWWFLPWGLGAQSAESARQVLDSLCSAAMHGRGYVAQGEKLAAEYLAREYRRIGLEPLSGTGGYFQSFELSCNTLPGKLSFALDRKTLRPGVDYLVHPDAPTFDGRGELFFLEKKDILDGKKLAVRLAEAKDKFLVVDERAFDRKNNPEEKRALEELEGLLAYYPNVPAKAVLWMVPDKLVWFPAPQQAKRPIVLVKSEFFSKKQPKRARLQIEAVFYPRYPSQNVLGRIVGSRCPDSVVMVTAHYDHLGRMGAGVHFPGANDNASGVAMLLQLARYFSQPGHRPEYTLVFACFGSEEIGLLGSRYFVENPLFPLADICFLLNLDILGTGIDGITVVNGSVYRGQFDRLVQLNDRGGLLKKVQVRGEACISDHCFFHRANVPSFYVYTLGGIAEYHNVYDRPETLTLEAFDSLLELFAAFLRESPHGSK